MRNKLFIEILRGNLRYTILAVIFQVLFALSVTLVSYSLTITFEAYNSSRGSFYRSIMFVLGVMGIATIMSYCSEYCKALYVKKTNESLKMKIAENTLGRAYELTVVRDTGKSISWFINDAEQIQAQSFSNFLNLIFMITLVVSAFVYIFMLYWLLAVIAMIFIGISLLVPKITQKYIVQAQERYAKVNEIYTETIRDNVEALSLFFTGNALSTFQIKMQDAVKMKEQSAFNFSITQAKIGSLMMLTSLLSQIGLVIFSLYFASLELTATSSVLSIAGLAGNLFNGIQGLSKSISIFQASNVLLNKFQSSKEEKNNFNESIECIKLEDIEFQYDDNIIFHNFSHEFIKGKKYVVIGDSGSGKSTLLKMMMGLSSVEYGKIEVNGINVQDIDLNQYYQRMAYIDQSIYFINGTIKENITLGIDITDEQMNAVIKRVKLDKFIQNQPFGLNTILESNAQGISGGERQRIALARALIKDVDFILIDESTSQLDFITRQAIEETMLEIKNVGVIYISHNTEQIILDKFDEIIHSSSFIRNFNL